MCKHCNNSKNNEEAWQQQVVEESNARQILEQLIEKSDALLDFYYEVNIDYSRKETKIKLDLEEALAGARKYCEN